MKPFAFVKTWVVNIFLFIKWNRRLELSGFDSLILCHMLRIPKFPRIFYYGSESKFNEQVGEALEFRPAHS